MEQITPSIIYCSSKRKDCPFKSVCKRYLKYMANNSLPNEDLTNYLVDKETYAICDLFILDKEDHNEQGNQGD